MDTGNPYGVLSNSQAVGDAQVQFVGNPEPLDVEVENLGFLGLNRDKRVKLLPEGFPKDALPRPSSSLFAIANKRGLFAAAGPKSFVIGSTTKLREAFTQEGEFTPQLAIPLPISISHIAFNADESHIILGASSGGLAVYLIDALSSSGDAKATFEVGTDGELREVKPNPTMPELVAIVTMGGDVQMLDLSTRAFKTGADGSPVLKSAVGTVAWSKRGKQIVCGMGDGTGWQMTPEGKGKATLPAPPGLNNHYASSIVWLENNLFIITHTPVPMGDSPNNESLFHLLARRESGFEFTKLYDPSPPYGMQERAPPYFFTAQLRNYSPALDDMIMFAGTCSTDIGVLVRFSEQNKEAPANTFVVAQLPDDTRRAQMPLSVDNSDTSPIGMALDLSAKVNVRRPVGGEEIEESPGPLPILMVLNYEGVLAAWNVIYNDAIQKGEKYSGMVIYESEQTQQQQQPLSTPAPARQMASPFSSPKPATTLAFGQSSFGAALPATTGGNAFGQPLFDSVSAFGQTATAPSGSGFVQPSAFGATSSSWSALSSTSVPALSSTGPAPALRQSSQLSAVSPAATLGGPSFGQPSQLGAKPAFGQPSTLGVNTTTPALGKPASGQSGFGGSLPSSGGAPAASGTFGSGSRFTAFANNGGFTAAAQASNGSQGGSIFGSGGAISSSNDSVFGGNKTGGSSFGSGVSDFKLGSAFKAESTQAEDSKLDNGGGSLGGFESLLGDALGSNNHSGVPLSSGTLGISSPFAAVASGTTASPFATPNKPSPFTAPATTSPFAGAPSEPSSMFGSAKPTSVFGQPNPFESKPTTISNPFGAPSALPVPSPIATPPSTTAQLGTPTPSTPEEAILPPDFIEPRVKSEPSPNEEGVNFNIPAVPLPPDTTSRPSYATGSTTTEGTPPSIPELPASPEGTPPSIPELPTSPEGSPLNSPVVEGEVPLPPSPPVIEEETPLPPSPPVIEEETPLPPSPPVVEEEAPLPPSPSIVEEEAPLPPSPSIVEEEAPLPPSPSIVEEEAPLPPSPSIVEEEAPLPPSFTPLRKDATPELPALPEYDDEDGADDERDDDDDGADDERDDDEDDEEDEDEDEEDGVEVGEESGEEGDHEEEGGDEGEEEGQTDEEAEREEVTPKKATNTFGFPLPAAKTTTPQTTTPKTSSSVLGDTPSFSDTFGTGIRTEAPFSDLWKKEEEVENDDSSGDDDDDDDDDEEEEEERPPRQLKNKQPIQPKGLLGRARPVTSTAKKSSCPSIVARAKKEEKGLSLFGSNQPSAGGPFGSRQSDKPGLPKPSGGLASIPSLQENKSPSLFSSDNSVPRTSGSPIDSVTTEKSSNIGSFGTWGSVPTHSPSLFGQKAPSSPSPFSQQAPPGSPFSQQVPSRTSSPFAPPKVPSTPQPPVEVEDTKSEVDFDAEYSDCEDEKIREQLLNAPLKPSDTLPEIKKLREAEVKEDFNHVFDSIYQSGNMMVNKLGQMARGLQLYHLAQQEPVEGVKHESPEDMKPTDDWRLCEMGLISKTIHELLQDVKKINKEKPELEEKGQIAAKGFIKLDTKESEIKRLLAVHNVPAAAVLARARPLAPEYQLKQRQLRKSFTRIEKALKDTEYKATMFKAKIAARDRHKAQAKFQPPTAEAVRTTVMKLTAMAEMKSKDVDHLEEKLRRVRLGSRSRSLPATPGCFDTPERELETPARRAARGGYGHIAHTPVMAVLEEGDVDEIVEDHKRRKEAGRKVRGALQRRGGRATVGET